MNLFIQLFTQIVSDIINQIYELWNKLLDSLDTVTDALGLDPILSYPLRHILELAFAICNQGDTCFNLGLNAAMSEMWNIIQPYIEMPFQCVNDIVTECEQATIMQFDQINQVYQSYYQTISEGEV